MVRVWEYVPASAPAGTPAPKYIVFVPELAVTVSEVSVGVAVSWFPE